MAKLGEVLKAKTVKGKLSFMSKMMIGIMSILGLGALLGAFVLNSQTRELSNNWMVANNIIADLDYLTSEFRLKQYHHIVSETDEEYNQIEKEVEEINQKIEGQMQAYRSTIQSDVDRQYFEHAYTAWQEYIEVSRSSVFMASREGNLTKAKNIMTGFYAYGKEGCPFEMTLKNLEYEYKNGSESEPFIKTAHFKKIKFENVNVSNYKGNAFIKTWSDGGETEVENLNANIAENEFIVKATEPFVCKAI